MENSKITVGNYSLGKTLGIGAFGKVKLGIHVPTGIKVAVKILNKAKISALEMGEKVRREINILKICKHPHIIRLYEVIDTPTDIFVAMEYAPGGELFDYIVSQGKPSLDEAQKFFQQLISAIEYCHFHGIIHRDLKPENLLLDEDNNLKIADFGLSNIIRDGEFLKTSCGSPNYAAPEVILGNLYAGPEVDVWSCGVILYALLCGSLPFDDDSIPTLFKKIRNGMYSLPAILTPMTRDLIPRMLLVDPIKRITISEIRTHQWFLQSIPSYLLLTPKELESYENRLDEEVVESILKLPIGKNVTKGHIAKAVLIRRGFKAKTRALLQLRVTYELLLGNKHAKERMMDCAEAKRRLQKLSPTFTPRGTDSPLRNDQNSLVKGSMHGMFTLSADHSNRLFVNPRFHSIPPKVIDANGIVTKRDSFTKKETTTFLNANLVAKRRWFLGIQSKKEPACIIGEVYCSLKRLGFTWRALSSYRIECCWHPSRKICDIKNAKDIDKKLGISSKYRIIMGMNLYKVQANIYLLDFVRKEGDQYTFMVLCAQVITQLKIISANLKNPLLQSFRGIPESQSVRIESKSNVDIPVALRGKWTTSVSSESIKWANTKRRSELIVHDVRSP